MYTSTQPRITTLLKAPLLAGTAGLSSPEERRPVVLSNSLALIVTLMVLSIGSYFYVLHPTPFILVPVVTEAAGFMIVILLNHYRQYFRASLIMLLIHGIFAVYWSCLLEDAIPTDLVIAFLAVIVFHLCSTFFLNKERKVLLSTLVITLSLMALVHVNRRHPVIVPLQLSDNAVYMMHLLTSAGFVTMMVLVMSFYIGKIHALLQSERKAKEASIAKSTFLRETYHELRTPLNAIYGIAQLLQLRKSDQQPTEERREIDDLYSACYIARNIINNVLDMSRIDAGRFNTVTRESVDLKACVGHCAAISRYIAHSRGIVIRESFDQQLPAIIRSDKIILTKIINNLLSNAVKFATGNSIVSVTCERHGQQLLFRVINEGIIHPEKARHIFEAFVSERNQITEATGLGLSITKHLVTLLGGRIYIEPDEMSTHTIMAFTLPLEAARENSHTPIKQHYRRDVFPGATALVIEDDPVSSALLTKVLAHMGIVPSLCHDGEAALQRIRLERPDIVITDLHMSGMSGQELLRQLRRDSFLKDIPVLIVSGDAFVSVKEELLLAGASAYISKPVHFNELYQALSAHLPRFQTPA